MKSGRWRTRADLCPFYTRFTTSFEHRSIRPTSARSRSRRVSARDGVTKRPGLSSKARASGPSWTSEISPDRVTRPNTPRPRPQAVSPTCACSGARGDPTASRPPLRLPCGTDGVRPALQAQGPGAHLVQRRPATPASSHPSHDLRRHDQRRAPVRDAIPHPELIQLLLASITVAPCLHPDHVDAEAALALDLALETLKQ